MDNNEMMNQQPVDVKATKPAKDKKSTIALVMAIISLVLMCVFGIGGIFSIIGLILAIMCLVKKTGSKGANIASIVISAITLICSIVIAIIEIIAVVGALTTGAGLAAFNKWDKENDDYTYEYDYDDDDYDYDYDYEYDNAATADDADATGSMKDYYDSVTSDYDNVTVVTSIGGYVFSAPSEFTFVDGDGSYQLFDNETAQYEFPAYVYDTTGYTKEDAFETLATSMAGEVDDSNLYYYAASNGTSWYYGEQDFYNEYNEYTHAVIAFEDGVDKCVILMVRPKDGNYNSDCVYLYQMLDHIIPSVM